MPFTSRQHQLLLDSCYHDPQLPEYLERMLIEGPGDYNWPPAPGQYAPEEFPLWERVWAQIWHQGDIYPATYIAVPVLCEVVARFPAMNHVTLLSQLLLIERSRPYFEPQLRPHLDDETVTLYKAALTGLLPLLPAQLRMQDDSTENGLRTTQNILALLAFVTGQQWAGAMLSYHDTLIDIKTGELSPTLKAAAEMLERYDLTDNVQDDWESRWGHLHTRSVKPPEGLEY